MDVHSGLKEKGHILSENGVYFTATLRKVPLPTTNSQSSAAELVFQESAPNLLWVPGFRLVKERAYQQKWLPVWQQSNPGKIGNPKG